MIYRYLIYNMLILFIVHINVMENGASRITVNNNVGARFNFIEYVICIHKLKITGNGNHNANTFTFEMA